MLLANAKEKFRTKRETDEKERIEKEKEDSLLSMYIDENHEDHRQLEFGHGRKLPRHHQEPGIAREAHHRGTPLFQRPRLPGLARLAG